MRLSNIIERVYNRPLLITPTAFHSIHAVIQSKLAGEVIANPIKMQDDEEDLFADPNQMIIQNGIATIPVYGVIGNHLGMIEKICGGVDIRDIKANIDLAMEDNNVETILLDINSPGGSVDYVPEVAQYIAECNKKKKIYAYTPDIMASAGYYLAAGCEEVYAHPAATAIGSIGVYSAYLDQSMAFAQKGLQWNIASKGKFKTEGLQGTSLSEEYKQMMQESVDEIYEAFTSFVKSNRPSVTDDELQGLTYDASTAMRKGFVDGLVESPMEIFVK